MAGFWNWIASLFKSEDKQPPSFSVDLMILRRDVDKLQQAIRHSDSDRLDRIEEQIEAWDQRYHRAYARTAETRLDNLEKQNDRYHEREKELLERWKAHVADLQREVLELREENRRLKSNDHSTAGADSA